MYSWLTENPMYKADISEIIKAVDISRLAGKSVMISGATGMIGSLLVDTLLSEEAGDYGIKVTALGRSRDKAANRFNKHMKNPLFRFIECDITAAEGLSMDAESDYIIHLASTTHPVAYATEPISTITSNVIGTRNLLEYGRSHGLSRFIFVSSVEIYGENRGDTEAFSEDYCGYINPNTLRAGYPESKRVSEALCQAYRKQYGTDICIPRLSRVFGPTMLPNDSKAMSQFIRKAAEGSDIVLKSNGTQLYSYCYAADAVSAILTLLISGKDGEAYNVAGGDDCSIMLRDLAKLIASAVGRTVVFELPDETERAGYSTATKAVLDISKIRALGWEPRFSMKESLEKTIHILQSGRN